LERYKKPPEPLRTLLRFDGDARSKRFLCQIQYYNSLFAFTSLGAVIDKAINNGTAPYVFRINSVVHHRIGTLLPRQGSQLKFAQLYIHDPDAKLQSRLHVFESDDAGATCPDSAVTQSIMEMLDVHNELVKAFCCAREHIEQTHNSEITLHLLGCNTRHDVQYNLPSSGEIAVIIVGDYSSAQYMYDVLVHAKNHGLKHVSHLHPCYMAMQYPLLFPYGEHEFHLGIRYADDDVNEQTIHMTMLEFVRYHTHYRLRDANPNTCYGRLSDQIGVNAYSTVEASRLQFIADHQKDLRYEIVQGVSDAIDKGLVNADFVGS
jgi:hypothetical protein